MSDGFERPKFKSTLNFILRAVSHRRSKTRRRPERAGSGCSLLTAEKLGLAQFVNFLFTNNCHPDRRLTGLVIA